MFSISVVPKRLKTEACSWDWVQGKCHSPESTAKLVVLSIAACRIESYLVLIIICMDNCASSCMCVVWKNIKTIGQMFCHTI